MSSGYFEPDPLSEALSDGSGPVPSRVVERSEGVIIGWRGWYVYPWAQEMRLRSVAKTAIWKPGEPIVAADPKWDSKGGIHAFKERADLEYYMLGSFAAAVDRHSYGRVAVLGQVALWGWIIEHENGYRAQFAYPQSLLVVPPDIIGQKVMDIPSILRGIYGVEAAWCPPRPEVNPWDNPYRDLTPSPGALTLTDMMNLYIQLEGQP